MIRGVYRVRRRRFEEVRSDSNKVGSIIIGGSGNGGSIIRLVSIATLSVSLYDGRCWSTWRSTWGFPLYPGSSPRNRTVSDGLRCTQRTPLYTGAALQVDVFRVVTSAGAATLSERGNEPTTCEVSTAMKGNCGFTESVTALCSWIWEIGTCTICFVVCCSTRSYGSTSMVSTFCS